MKTARNSLKGYTYQNYIFTLLLAKMDVERNIKKIVSEATDTKNFDDAYVELADGGNYRLQVKNYAEITMNDIRIDSNNHKVIIHTNENVYDSDDNNVFIVNSNLKVSGTYDFLGFPAIKIDEILIVPLSEEKVASLLEGLFQQEIRALQIIQFGYTYTCSGKFEVSIDDLPPIITFSTELNQETIMLRGTPKEIKKGITYIVGKPGVGKSHYVNELFNAFPKAIIYRFWIGQQDSKYNERLRYDVFIEQIGLLVFQSPKSFTIEQLADNLVKEDKCLFVDGLDHVENYNPNDLQKFIDFFNLLNDRQVRILILSRPMKAKPWEERQELLNWTYDETALYLAAAHGITDYFTQKHLFEVTSGYPIITFFFAEHFKKYGELATDSPVKDINSYYDALLAKVEIKSLLSIFAVNNSFFTHKELQGFMGAGTYTIVSEFISGYPYLFELVENRVALIHDSFNTYLRNQLDGYATWKDRINETICDKLLSGDVEYMARLSSFQLEESFICDLLKQYADFDAFKRLMQSTVDFNSIASFYEQLRRILEFRRGVLDIYQYYAFTLIYQIVTRNDLVGYEDLVFQILCYIKKNADIEDQIFSSDLIWNVFLACRNRPDAMKKYMANTLYGSGQLDSAYESIKEEIEFFDCLTTEQNAAELLEEIDAGGLDSLHKSDLLQKYLEVIWIQRNVDLPFYKEFNDFVVSDRKETLHRVIQSKYHFDNFWTERVYYFARYRLHELGFFEEKNFCRQGTILNIIRDKAPEGSFGVAPVVLSFLRLANHEGRPVDIYNINYVWSMYAQRKDYSVHTIDTALVVYENKGLIEESDSIKIIDRLMKQSEKGIRHLLASYIDLKGAGYVKRLVDSGKIFDESLELDYFELNPENINCLPAKAIKSRLAEVIRYHDSKYVNGSEIKNAIKSKYSQYICDVLDYFDMKVMDGLSDEEINIIEAAGIKYITKSDSEGKEEYIPFNHGCISRNDFDYIRQNGLSAMECSRYADGWYTCLPYVDLYEMFDVNEIRVHYLAILHQALFARVIENEHIGNWNDIIGNIPKFLEKYGIEVDWKRLFNVTLRFMDLSVIYYPASLKKAVNSTDIDHKTIEGEC